MKEKSFKFRENFGKALMLMTDQQAGELIKGLSIYAFNGKLPDSQDSTVQSSFTLMKSSIEQDKRDRANGRKGGLKSAEKRKLKSSTDTLDEVIKYIVLEILDGQINAANDEKSPQQNEEKPIAKT